MAIENLEKANTIAKKVFGENHISRAKYLINLVRSFEASGNLEKAIFTLKECYEICHLNLGDKDPTTIYCFN